MSFTEEFLDETRRVIDGLDIRAIEDLAPLRSDSPGKPGPHNAHTEAFHSVVWHLLVSHP